MELIGTRLNMPELPEVRTVAKVLKKLANKNIVDIKIIYPKLINPNSLDINLLINKRLIDVNTFGKYLLFDFEEYILISHLRMEGKYFIKSISDPYLKHEHIALNFNDEISLRYHDTRKFGRMQLIKKDDLNKVTSITKLAKEPFDIDKETFYNKINKKNIPIKSILLDQTIINGLGNIYVNEVLYDSKINPLRLGKDITQEESNRLVDSSIKILSLAIKEGGTTIKSYTSSLGVTGNYQNHLKVHMKDKELCNICNNKIEKIKIGGRSTYYCKVCQK